MTVSELKDWIYRNQKIEYVLEQIGCHDIFYHPLKEYYSCSNPDGDNKSAVNVKNNKYLNVTNWTRSGFDDKADLITLVEYSKKCSFIDAVKYLHNLFNLPYKRIKKPQNESEIAKEQNRLARYSRRKINVSDIPVLDESIINDYIPILHISWFKEGIIEKTRKKFGIAYSYKKKRIIIPIRHWLTKELVGINARTTVENYDEFGIKKYFLTPTYQKSNNLYGLAENYDAIQSAGFVVVVESEKSVLKRDSLLDDTLVALSGKTMSDEQVRILIGLNVDIVIALDKDVPIQEVWHICEKFYRSRNVYYIQDQWDLLSEKDSAIDKGDKIYTFLLKHKVKYDVDKHREYLKYMKG